MTPHASVAAAVLAAVALGGCASSGSSAEPDCASHYEKVAAAPTWPGLRRAMLQYDAWGRVASVRIQARNLDAGVGPERVVRVADLLDQRGRRLVQVDVWRTDTGEWRAGLWHQCTD